MKAPKEFKIQNLEKLKKQILKKSIDTIVLDVSKSESFDAAAIQFLKTLEKYCAEKNLQFEIKSDDNGKLSAFSDSLCVELPIKS